MPLVITTLGAATDAHSQNAKKYCGTTDFVRFRELGILTCHSSPNTLPEVTDQPNDSGGSSCHILAVWQMRSATASMDVRALSPASPPPCGIGKMNRPLLPHCQIAEKSSRLRGRKMTSVRASLSTSSRGRRRTRRETSPHPRPIVLGSASPTKTSWGWPATRAPSRRTTGGRWTWSGPRTAWTESSTSSRPAPRRWPPSAARRRWKPMCSKAGARFSPKAARLASGSPRARRDGSRTLSTCPRSSLARYWSPTPPRPTGNRS